MCLAVSFCFRITINPLFVLFLVYIYNICMYVYILTISNNQYYSNYITFSKCHLTCISYVRMTSSIGETSAGLID